MEVECVHKACEIPPTQSIVGRGVEVHIRRAEVRVRDHDSKVPRPARRGARVKLRKVEVHPGIVERVSLVREGDCQVAWAGARRRQGGAEDEPRDVVGKLVLVNNDVGGVGDVFDVGRSLAHEGRAWTHRDPVAIQSIVWVPALHSISASRWV